MLHLNTLDIDSVPRVEVGPGCSRRDLPCIPGARAWIVDMEPGSQWPYPDHHGPGGEAVLVLSGELLEGGAAYGPGTYLHFGPQSVHQPHTAKGVRLFGINAAA